MRDLLLLILLPFLVFMAFKRPFIALSLWLWSSVFNINQLVYGIASFLPYSKLFAGLTFVSFLVSKQKSNFKLESISIFIFLFFAIATISNFFAIGDVEFAWQRWQLFFKIILFYYFAVTIIEKKIHFDCMVWVLIITIAALASTEGIKFLVSGGGHRFGVLPGISGDNNFFGVMVVTVIPLVYYIYTQTKHNILRKSILGIVFFMVLGIIASYSRGAFLGLVIIAIISIKNSKRQFLWVFLVLGLILVFSWLMPDEWLSRMNTIESAGEDSSFMGRVVAWKLSILIAMDNFFGGGFKALENSNVWFLYSQSFDKLDFIISPLPDETRFHASHSIYFQVLGNHGFLGLSFFLVILLLAYLKLEKITKLAIKHNLDNWIVTFSKALKVSLITYSISGAAVNVAYFDFFYLILAFVVTLDKLVFVELKEITGFKTEIDKLKYEKNES